MNIAIYYTGKTSINISRNCNLLTRRLPTKTLLVSNISQHFSSVRSAGIFVFKKPLRTQLQLEVNKKFYSDEKSSIVPKSSRSNAEVSTSIKETVKETTKTTFSTLVIIAGVGVAGLLFYVVFRELFSGKSPNSVYTKAFERCAQDPRVQDALGEPIKGHGETTRRGRRRHVNHVKYIKDEVEHLRMQFYLKGCRKSATVQLEVIESASGSYDYRYLFVQLDEWPNKVIVLEDNRHDRTGVGANVPTPLDVESTDQLNFS